MLGSLLSIQNADSMQEKNVCIVPISHSNNYLSKEDLALFIAGLNHASEGYIIEIPSDIESHKHDIDNCIYLTIVNDHLYCKTHLTPNHNWVVLEGPFFDKGNIFYQKILTKNVSTIDENDRQNLFQVLEQKNYIYQKYDHVAFVLTGELARFTRAIHSPLSPIDRRDPTVIEDSSAIDNQWKEAHETIINRLTIPFSFSTWDMWTKNDQLSQPLERIKEKYLAGSHQNLLMNPETEIDSINSDTSDEFDQSDSIFAAAIDERLRQVSNGIGRKNKYDPSKGSIRRFNLENTIGMAKKYIFEELALISLWANPGLLSESGLRVTMLYPFEGEAGKQMLECIHTICPNTDTWSTGIIAKESANKKVSTKIRQPRPSHQEQKPKTTKTHCDSVKNSPSITPPGPAMVTLLLSTITTAVNVTDSPSKKLGLIKMLEQTVKKLTTDHSLPAEQPDQPQGARSLPNISFLSTHHNNTDNNTETSPKKSMERSHSFSF